MSIHRTVLVIADSNESSVDYEYQLQQDGSFAYRILTNCHNIYPLTLPQSQQIDGILLERYSPHSKSVDILRQLKQQMGDRCPPIVVIDGNDAEVAVRAFKDGAADYLVKDRMTSDDLRLAMRTAIENAELRQELQRSQEQFQTSVENMLDCFGIFSAMRDESGKIVDFRIDYLNEAACENNRMPKEIQIGRGLCEVLPAHRESGLFDEYCQVVETAKPLIKDSLIYDDTYGEQRLIRAFDIRASKLNDGFVASWRDVTDRKQLELNLNQTITDLQLQQNRLQRLINNAPIGIGIGSSAGDIVAMNDAMLHLYGYTRQELAQLLNWRDFVPPERMQESEQFLNQLQQQGFLPPHETERLHADGSRIPILFSGMKWLDDADEHIIFAMDLSQQKQAETAIQQLNRDLTLRVTELQTLLDMIPVGIAIATDATCTRMHSNAYLRQLLGVNPDRNISKSAPEEEQPPYRVFRAGQEIPATDLPMQIAAQLGIDVRDAEFDILLPDGTLRQLLSYATPLRDDHSQIRGVVGAFLDITERNQDAAALKASQQRYRDLAEAMPQMVWTADATGAVNYWNQQWYEYTGLSETASMGLAGASTVHPDDRDRTLTQWSAAIAQGESFEIEYRIQHWSGDYQWFICRAIPTRDSQKRITGWIGTITNIDDIKHSEALLQKSEQQLQQQLAEIEAIYQTAPIGLSVLDADCRFIRINKHLAAINGLPIAAHIGRTLWEVIPDLAETLAQCMHQALATGEPLLNVEIHGETVAQPGVKRTWLEQFLPLKAGDQVIGISTVCEEITERIQIEAALRQSEEQFRNMADNAPVMVWVTDANGYCTYLSKSWYDFTGQTEATGLGFGWLEAVHPDDAQVSGEIFLKANQNQAAFRLEYRLRHKDGEYHWAIDAASPWFDEDAKFKGYIGSVIDISDRKQIEIALAANESRLRGFVDANVVGILYGDIYGNINEANDELLRIVGYTQADLRAGNLCWIDITPPEYLPLDEQGIAEAKAKGACTPYEKEYIRKDGSRVPVLIGYSLVGETKEETVVFILDLSDRKQAEADLRQSEARYRTLFESIDEGFCIIEMLFDRNQKPIDYRFLEINPAFEKHTGLINAKGKRMRELVPNHEEYWFEIYGNVMQTGIPSRFESHAKAMNRWYDVYAFRIEQSAGHRVAVLFNDITDRKLSEQERERLLAEEQSARAEAERANRIKDEFLAVLSHELRSPLNPILGWTKLLQTRKLDAPKTAEALATIERNARIQTQLIDDLLDVAKILRGKLNLTVTSVNLSSVIEAAIDTVKTSAIAKSITLESKLSNIGQVSGDEARLQQVVWNLLSNAIKFTPNGGNVKIELSLVTCQPPLETNQTQIINDRHQLTRHAQIIVSDTGKGIAPDFLPHIFESFRQEDASITRRYGGLGLGLAIVRQLVEAHGGTIKADSPGEGLGATFTVRLPLLDAKPQIKQPDQPPQDTLDLTGIRVLAVDDDPDARELLTVLLTQFGAEVLAVTSATEVLASLESFQPDILVSDIGMPEVDGYSLIQRVRALPVEKGGQIPAIALTAYAREDDYQRAITSGYQRHVTKPLDPSLLVQAVMVLVGGVRG